MKLGTVQLPACQVGPQRPPFTPQDGGGRQYFYADLLFPGVRQQVAVSGEQYRQLTEGVVIRPTCELAGGNKLKLTLTTFEVVKQPAANGAVPARMAAAGA